MSTRNRTKGTSVPQTVVYSNRSNFPGGSAPWGSWVARPEVPVNIGFDYVETMTDTIGANGASNPVTHARTLNKQRANQGKRIIETKSGSVKIQLELVPPLNFKLQEACTHLGGQSGLKALAVARVPAYDNATVQGFVSLAESLQVADTMVVSGARALAQFAKVASFTASKGRSGFRKNISREAMRSLDDLIRPFKSTATTKKAFQGLLTGMSVANAANMEWKYGWAPMLKDIQVFNSNAQKLMTIHERLVKGTRVYGRAIDVRTQNGSDTITPVRGDASTTWGNWTFEYSKTTKTTCVASVMRKLNPSASCFDTSWFNSLDVVMELNGLRPSLKSAWQLSSLTFITDWFWNVSQLLESSQSLKAPIGSNFTSTDSMYSVKTVTTVNGSLTTPAYAGFGSTSVSGSIDKMNYSRQLDPLTGGPAFYVPPLKFPFEGSKWWSIAQIAFQRLLK